ncbi:MAG: hypothetical protein JXQ99_05175 [Hyphomicrobiaceae bacterium]
MTVARTSPVMPVARVWRLSNSWKQFLLSLLNATLLLGIIFVALSLILVSKVETFSENALDKVRLGPLQEIGADVKSTVDAIGTTEKELKLIADRLNAMVKHPEITLSPVTLKEMRSIRDELKRLQTSTVALPDETANQLAQRIDSTIGRSTISIFPATQQELGDLTRDVRTMQKTLVELTSSHAAVSDHAIRSIASAVANAIIEVRQCRVKPERERARRHQ